MGCLHRQNKETFVGDYNSLYGNSSFSPDGKTYASLSYEIHLWDVNTGKKKKTLSGNENRVKKVLFSPDGKTLAGKEYRNVITYGMLHRENIRVY